MRAVIFLLVLMMIFPIVSAQMRYTQTNQIAQVRPQIAEVRAVCPDGVMRCSDAVFQKCTNGVWKIVNKCSEKEFCDVKKGCVALQYGQMGQFKRVPTTPMKLKFIMLPDMTKKTTLTCPKVPNNPVALPPPVYDEKKGDCALKGKSAAIGAYLAALEKTAAECNARRAAGWQKVLDTRTNLDDQVDMFELTAQKITVCTSYSSSNPLEPGEGEGPKNMYYTIWLKHITEHVTKYCKLIDELIKPIWQACDEINFYQDCQAPNPTQYHKIIAADMNAANINYGYTDFFYTNTLQITGWGNFKKYFNEKAIDCPGNAQQALPAKEIDYNQYGQIPIQEEKKKEPQSFSQQVAFFFSRLFGHLRNNE